VFPHKSRRLPLSLLGRRLGAWPLPREGVSAEFLVLNKLLLELQLLRIVAPFKVFLYGARVQLAVVCLDHRFERFVGILLLQ
jgi:hypothetical protein